MRKVVRDAGVRIYLGLLSKEGKAEYMLVTSAPSEDKTSNSTSQLKTIKTRDYKFKTVVNFFYLAQLVVVIRVHPNKILN